MTTPNTVELDGATYVIGKLDAFKQLHVARKIAPIITSLGASAAALAVSERTEVDAGLALMGPALDVVSRMEEADVDYVVRTCLSAVHRLSGAENRPAKIIQGSNFMFQDIELPQMIRLTVEVVRENLSSFFPLLNAVMTSQTD